MHRVSLLGIATIHHMLKCWAGGSRAGFVQRTNRKKGTLPFLGLDAEDIQVLRDHINQSNYTYHRLNLGTNTLLLIWVRGLIWSICIFPVLWIVCVRLADGTVLTAEVHWYEAHGIGKREFKIKRYLE